MVNDLFVWNAWQHFGVACSECPKEYDCSALAQGVCTKIVPPTAEMERISCGLDYWHSLG